MSSARGTRVPDATIRTVKVRMCTFGRLVVSSEGDVPSTVWRSVEVLFNSAGVGPRDILMTCSTPAR